jgi:dTDP-4-amino-4,6-dideoxygalactose transaminase
MIAQNDFKRQWGVIQSAAIRAAERVGSSGWYILGEEVEAFERALALITRRAFAIGVGNGMDALEISLRSLGAKPGDKVLTTPVSAFATTLAIIRLGAVPVFVDVDDLGRIDLQACGDVLSRDSSIRFFVPVHLYGIPLDLVELRELQQRFDLVLIEDCAQAIGARSHGINVGTVGQAAALSFYPTKNLGALGDGGAIVTDDPTIAQNAKRIRNYGQSSLYCHDDIGLNSRLDELHAAMLREAMLPHLQPWTEARRRTARRYHDAIRSRHITLPRSEVGAEPVWHLFPVLADDGRRKALREHFRSAGIATGVHYPTLIPEQIALRKYGRFETNGDLANAKRFAAHEVSLPIHPFLQDDEIDAVIGACNRWLGQVN